MIRILMWLFCLYVTVGCSKRTLTLTQPLLKDNRYLVLQLDRADLYFNRDDILASTELGTKKETIEKSKNEINAAYTKVKGMNFDVLFVPLKLDKDEGSDKSNAHLLVYLFFSKLLKQGKVSVYNKSIGKFESKIIRKTLKSKLGNATAVYTFEDGTEFYDEVVAFGE